MPPEVDNSKFFQRSEYPMRDAVFNWVVRRYGRLGHKWKKSDQFIFYNAIYFIWDYFWIIIFLYLIYWIANAMYERYGMWRAVLVIGVIFLLRMNQIIRKLDQQIKLLKQGR